MVRKQAGKTLFDCVYCHSHFALDYSPPEKWTVSRYVIKDRFKYTCASCGAFIYPVDLLGAGKSPDADIFTCLPHV